MNILIVGEFSGFAKHLKNGFRKLGHQVTIVMRQDSFKKFRGEDDDILYGNNIVLFGQAIRGSARLLKPFSALGIRWKLWKRYKSQHPDLIFVVNYNFITTSLLQLGTPLSFIENQLQNGSKLIMSECGLSPAGFYNHPDFFKKRGKVLRYEDFRYSFLLKYSHVILPTHYGYYDDLLTYANFHRFDTGKVHNAIPLPITIKQGYIFRSCVGRKIVIFHGIIRPIYKGTSFIQAAMDRLKEEMPERVECVSRGGMPYEEYVKLFDSMDILVDQTYGNGWGMNAIIGAMNGKCVLTPCGPENRDNMGIPDIPFIQIGPDSEQIYQTLRNLVLNPEHIDEIKQASRRFAEEYCECSLIAQRYLDVVDL